MSAIVDPTSLKQVCIHRGSALNGVDIVFQDDIVGYAIIAREILNKGDILMKIPFHICISSNLVVSYAKLSHIFAENPSLLDYPDEVLAIGIMYAAVAADKDCPWLSHVEILPKSFNTPIFWKSEEIDELKPSATFHLTKMLLRQIESDWENIHHPLSNTYPDIFGKFSCDLYKWSLSVIYSRAVGIDRKGKYTRCIPPLLDMANHNPEVCSLTDETINYDSNSDSIVLLSAQSRDIGEEVYALYGTYPNSKLLYSYGFVASKNPHRAVDIWARLETSSFQYAQKQKLLSSNTLTKVQTYDFIGTIRDKYISPALLATIRIIQICDDAELALASNAFASKMISVRNEIASYTALREFCILRINADKVSPSKVSFYAYFYGNRLSVSRTSRKS
jgi:hypothetical protein